MASDVNTPSPEYEEMEKDRELCRVLLYDGQRGIRDGGETYLPRYEGETGTAGDDASEYGGRLSRSYLRNFFREAVDELVGRMFGAPLVFTEDTPEEILELWENIDACGTHGDAFIQSVARDAIAQGVSGVLVDYPLPQSESRNRAEEQRLNLRPKWVHYKGHSIIEAMPLVLSRPYLRRLRLRDSRSVPGDAEYDYASELLVREYLMGSIGEGEDQRFFSYRLHVYDDESGEWIPGEWQRADPGMRSQLKDLFIEPPMVPFYALREDFFVGAPVYAEVAQLNLQYYQLRSNIDNLEYTSTVPTLLQLGGQEDQELEVGAHRKIWIPSGADLRWLELQTGKGLEHAKQSLASLKQDIRESANDPMARQAATGDPKATIRILDEAETLTEAQKIALGILWSANRCLELTAGWLGLDRGGSVEFDESVLDALHRPQGFDSVERLFALGALSAEDALREARRYGIIDRNSDIDEMSARLRRQMPPSLGGGELEDLG